MNSKHIRYATGAALLLVLSVLFTKEAVSNIVPQQPYGSGIQTAASQYSFTGPISNPFRTRPTRIVIPTAQVNAEVIDIGVTKTNNLDVPPNYYQAGWYKYGPLPGNPGNAVIDGHVDNGGKVAGPFKNLRNAKVGDEITVQMSDGSNVIFVVTDASVSSYLKFPKETVFRGDNTSVLKIITCHGTFLPAADTYDQRLIVTAVKKSPQNVAVR